MEISQSSSIPKYLQEEDNNLSQECKQILSSLPKEKGWAEPNLYKYQGFWYPSWQFQGVVESQKHFQAQDSDVFLVSSPKCGTTWLKALAFTIINRSSFPINTSHPLMTKNPHQIVPCLELDFSSKNDQFYTSFPFSSSPRLISTHLPYVSLPNCVQNSLCKVVYISRNPKDVFISLWHFMNNLRESHLSSNSKEEVFDMFCKGVSLFGPFWDHVLEYWKESLKRPKKVLFLRYEDMKEEARIYVKKLGEFLDCSFSFEEEKEGLIDEIINLCSFENMRNLEVNKSGKLPSGVEHKAFFRQGKVGNWKNELTHQMIHKLNCLSQDKFHGSGLQI